MGSRGRESPASSLPCCPCAQWHAGLATVDHTPAGRGYDTALSYFAAANGFWDEVPDSSVAHCPSFGSMTDLWATAGPAKGLNNSRSCTQAAQAPPCVYEDELFKDSVVATIAAHDPATPLFLFVAWHK